MRKLRWKRVILWVCLLIIGMLLGAEVALRLIWGLGHPLLYRDDAATGYIVAPSQHVVRNGCVNNINSQSMRSPEILSPKPPGEFRLLLIGDSITYGTTYVDQSQIFSTLLNQSLPQLLKQKVEVLNASAGGWAPANELGYLHSRGDFDADMVIFVLNTGDLTQVFSTSMVGKSPSFPDRDPPCALAELFDHYILARIRNIRTADAGSQAEVVDIPRQTPPNLALLHQAKTLANTAHAYFAIVYIPAQGAEWAPYAPGLQMLKDWCHGNSVDLVDLTSAFAESTPEQIAFDNGHGHLRPLGHSIVAKVVAHYLSTKPWVAAKSATRPGK